MARIKEKAPQNEEPPADGSGFPETPYPVHKKGFELNAAGMAKVDLDIDTEYAIDRCPYCGTESRLGDRKLDVDGAEVTFSCKQGHGWIFFPDKVDGEMSMKKGYIRGLNSTPRGTNEEPND